MSSSLMSTEPGGESTQYESMNTVTKPHSKQGGQMGDPETQVDSTTSQAQQENAERGEKTAENIRYGESISEHGFGGETTTNSGEATQEGGEAADTTDSSDDIAKPRREQGYGEGPGSEIGA